MTTEALKVLVVDDDYRVTALHVAFIERLPGFEAVGQAHTAAEAVDLTESLRPDVVLLDVYLPDGDGLSVARKILDLPPFPAVIVISAANDTATVRQAAQLGAVHYLVKPFGFAALAETLTGYRKARAQISRLPDEADQQGVNRIFTLLRPPRSGGVAVAASRLAPTTRLVFDTVVGRAGGMSASEVAEVTGISRATAQRCLTQLEQNESLELELRYGSAGRPEHRYSVKAR